MTPDAKPNVAASLRLTWRGALRVLFFVVVLVEMFVGVFIVAPAVMDDPAERPAMVARR